MYLGLAASVEKDGKRSAYIMTSLPLSCKKPLQTGSLLSSVMIHLALLRPIPVQLWLLLHADIRKGPPGAETMTESVQLTSCWGLGHLSAAKLKFIGSAPRQSFDIVATQIQTNPVSEEGLRHISRRRPDCKP